MDVDSGIAPQPEQFRQLCGQGNVIPVYREILADTETPVSAYLKIRQQGGYSFLLESVEGGERAARYSFLGTGPTAVFRARGHQVTIDEGAGRVRTFAADPVAAFRQFMATYRSVHLPELPRFTGGAVGYLGYDGIRLVEDLPDTCTDDLGLDDMVFAVFETIVAFDNLRHTALLITHADLRHGADPETAYIEAGDRLGQLEDLLNTAAPRGALPTGEPLGTVRSNTAHDEYIEQVERCLEYIRAGDIFQVVFSQRFEAEVRADPVDIYRVLRTVNPSPYMFHIDLDGVQVLGASPEILVRVEDGVLDVRPIAGTRARGATPEADAALEAELLAVELFCHLPNGWMTLAFTWPGRDECKE